MGGKGPGPGPGPGCGTPGFGDGGHARPGARRSATNGPGSSLVCPTRRQQQHRRPHTIDHGLHGLHHTVVFSPGRGGRWTHCKRSHGALLERSDQCCGTTRCIVIHLCVQLCSQHCGQHCGQHCEALWPRSGHALVVVGPSCTSFGGANVARVVHGEQGGAALVVVVGVAGHS